MAAERGAVGLARCSLGLDPREVQRVGRKALDETLLRHAALVDRDPADLALVAAHVVDLRAQHAAQPVDRFHREADRHHLVAQRALRLAVGRRVVAALVEGLVQFLEARAHRRELVERGDAHFFEASRHRAAAALAVVIVVAVVERVDVFLGHVVVGLAGDNEAIDDIGDCKLSGRDLLAEREDLGHHRRRCRDREHHRLQSALDAFGDVDLALARQQLERAHLTHVHANRVGRAAEFRVDGRQRGLGRFFGFVLGPRRAGAAGHQQRRSVGRFLVDGDAHVVEHLHRRLEHLGVDQLFGQVVVDFLLRQVAARLAGLHEHLQLGAALVGFFFGEVAHVEAELADQRPLLRFRHLHAKRLGRGVALRRRFEGNGVVAEELSARGGFLRCHRSVQSAICVRPVFIAACKGAEAIWGPVADSQPAKTAPPKPSRGRCAVLDIAAVSWWSRGESNPRPQAIIGQIYMLSWLIWI